MAKGCTPCPLIWAGLRGNLQFDAEKAGYATRAFERFWNPKSKIACACWQWGNRGRHFLTLGGLAIRSHQNERRMGPKRLEGF
jgi:hypothetical protein